MNSTRKVILFIASSLDGYIAGEDDSLDWLYRVEGEGDNGFSEFYDTVDTVLMGKRSYDWIIQQQLEEFPYIHKQCYVFTHSSSLTADYENVQWVSEDIVSFVRQLKQQEGKHIWMVGGGDLLHSFIQQQLIDELIITVAPALLGKGIPLFRKGEQQLDLRLKTVRTFNQFVELHYEVK